MSPLAAYDLAVRYSNPLSSAALAGIYFLWLGKVPRPGPRAPRASRRSHDARPLTRAPRLAQMEHVFERSEASQPHEHRFESSNWGDVVLVDPEGLGSLRLGDTVISRCSRWGDSPTAWLDETGRYGLFLLKRGLGTSDLVVVKKGCPAEGMITIQDWTVKRNLGIELEGHGQPPCKPADRPAH